MSGSGMESMAGQALGKDSEQDGVPDDGQRSQKCSLERRCLRRTDTHFNAEVQHDNGKNESTLMSDIVVMSRGSWDLGAWCLSTER
jgi:hypothetical protein